jgi:hypothetical protein
VNHGDVSVRKGKRDAQEPTADAGRPAAACPGSGAPSNVRLGRLNLRHRAWPRGRRARSGGVLHTSERVQSRLNLSPPRLSQPPVPRPSPQGPPAALPYRMLRRLSSPRQSRATPRSAGLQAAPARPPRRAGVAAIAAGEACGQGLVSGHIC